MDPYGTPQTSPLSRVVFSLTWTTCNLGKISAQPRTTLCIQFLDSENNDKNNTLPLGKQICFTIVVLYIIFSKIFEKSGSIEIGP